MPINLVALNNVSVVYELDNAKSREDRAEAVNSFRSVLASGNEFRSASDETQLEVVAVGDSKSIGDLGHDLAAVEKELCAGDMTTRWIAADGLRYFDKKVLGAVLATHETVVFADSDCSYSMNWIRTMASAVWSDSSVVWYGATYASASHKGWLEDASRLCWQFPPQSLRQAISHRRRWGNNFACNKAVMLANPIPSLHVAGYTTTEFKIERVLWERTLGKMGIEVRDVDTNVVHGQFSSVKDWVARHYVHGLADALGDQISGVGWKALLRRTWTSKWRTRRRELGMLNREGLIGRTLYLRALALTLLADAAQIFGRLALIARRPEVLIDWRSATSETTRWKELHSAITS